MYNIYYKQQKMHFGFMNVILLYSDNCHVWANHVVIFRVVSARIQTYLECVGITPQLKFKYFLLKLRLNGKTVTSIKYQKLRMVVWSMVLWSDVYRRYVW